MNSLYEYCKIKILYKIMLPTYSFFIAFQYFYKKKIKNNSLRKSPFLVFIKPSPKRTRFSIRLYVFWLLTEWIDFDFATETRLKSDILSYRR